MARKAATTYDEIVRKTVPADLAPPEVPILEHAERDLAPDELELETRVRETLVADLHMIGVQLGIQVEGRTVRLVGTVPTAATAEHAEKIVAALEGVDHVENKLEVER